MKAAAPVLLAEERLQGLATGVEAAGAGLLVEGMRRLEVDLDGSTVPVHVGEAVATGRDTSVAGGLKEGEGLRCV